MTAKEMFKKLGYEDVKAFGQWLRFAEERQYRRNAVEFNLKTKAYSIYADDEFGDPIYMGVSPKLHLAIHQQMIELGWIQKEERK